MDAPRTAGHWHRRIKPILESGVCIGPSSDLCAPLTQRRPDPPKPSMARAQLLTASALFCLVLGASNLRCRQCALEEPYIGCLPGFSECTPKAGHPCMTVNISYRGEVQFLIQGCIMNPTRCGLVKELLNPGYQINVTCCSHASFCNDWVPPRPIKGGR